MKLSRISNGQPVGLRYLEPAPELRTLISSYYVFWADLPKVTDVLRADLPQLRFMLSGQGHYQFANGSSARTPEVTLIGPTMGASHFAVQGPLLVFGVAMLPAGWAALVRDDASRHADGLEDATAIFGPLIADGLYGMRNAPTIEAMTAIADAVLGTLMECAVEGPLWFTRMTDAWLTGAASPDVDTLVAAAGMSARQVERLAKRIYGAPPKLLARKYRALRAASVLGSAHLSWQEVAGDAFYDQSHFIREVKHFTGLTPRQFQRDMPTVTRLTLQRRALTGRLPELALVS